jgi:hypothetical protein
MKKINLAFLTLIIASLFSGCIRIEPYDECDKPIYLSYEKLRSNYPAIKPPREIVKAGKIYVYGDILLINEKNKGIHVVDNSNREKPKNIHFIDIPGNIDMAVRDGYLYVDSFIDLVVLNINDINNITKVNRKEGIFPYNMEQALTPTDMDKNRCYADEKLGVVLGYE